MSVCVVSGHLVSDMSIPFLLSTHQKGLKRVHGVVRSFARFWFIIAKNNFVGYLHEAFHRNVYLGNVTIHIMEWRATFSALFSLARIAGKSS